MHIESLSGVLLYLAAFLIIFGENGVFFLFFLPGDSLLFALGVLATKGTVSLWYLIPILIVAAIGGNLLGYWLGSVTGRGFVKRLPKVKPEHLERAKRFYDTHGLLAVFLARWIPVLRTIVPYFAGVVGMRKRTFRLWSVLGGVAWISSVVLGGYFFGRELDVTNVGYLTLIVVLVAAVATPVFIGLIKRFVK
jgi:membrane-associated protein